VLFVIDNKTAQLYHFKARHEMRRLQFISICELFQMSISMPHLTSLSCSQEVYIQRFKHFQLKVCTSYSTDFVCGTLSVACIESTSYRQILSMIERNAMMQDQS
jgi:hypothetical protein